MARIFRSLKQSALRRNIGVVCRIRFCSTTPFARTLPWHARPAATLAEVRAAAETANIHDLALRLADGYDTLVGERGSLLGRRASAHHHRARLAQRPAECSCSTKRRHRSMRSPEAAVQSALERLLKGARHSSSRTGSLPWRMRIASSCRVPAALPSQARIRLDDARRILRVAGFVARARTDSGTTRSRSHPRRRATALAGAEPAKTRSDVA